MSRRASCRAVQPMLLPIAATLYNALAMTMVDLPDEAATAGLAARISALAETGDVIALRGDLGQELPTPETFE